MINSAIASEGENMSEIQALALRVQGLNQSVDWWNSAMIWALVFAAIAAIAVVVTTRVALARAKQLADVQGELNQAKDAQVALDLRDKDVKIADALKATEDERMARMQLEGMIQPRAISPAEQKELRGALHRFAGRMVSVRSYALDTEGSRLATIILSVLGAAGVHTSDQRGNLFNLSAGWNVVEGLQIAGPRSQDDLINALLHSPLGSSQHLKMFRKEDPNILPTAPVEIMVGVKPIAVLPL
jgi:hypothetical protein